MITIEQALVQVERVSRTDLDEWIGRGWVTTTIERECVTLRAIDVARLALIRDLRADLGLDEEAIPVVLSLLDQLHVTRRRLDRLCRAVARQPEAVRESIAREALDGEG